MVPVTAEAWVRIEEPELVKVRDLGLAPDETETWVATARNKAAAERVARAEIILTATILIVFTNRRRSVPARG